MKLGCMLAVCALGVAGTAGIAAADVDFELLYSVESRPGIGRGNLDRPVDVVEDREENIYVLDQGKNRIEVFDRRGGFLREWGERGFSPGALDTPSAMTIDRDTGNVFVVDTLNNRLQKFDPRGKVLLVIGRLGSLNGEFNRPLDVALDKRGNIYVADSGNDRVQKFDPSGRFLSSWGKFAPRKGVEIKNPVSVAYSDEGYGAIYVLTAPDCLVQKFDIDGQLVKTWEMHRKGEGALCGPSRIRIEPRRYTVYIADTENDRVILFDRDGEPLGSLRKAEKAFKRPGGVFINVLFGEDVLVADTGNSAIHKFRRVR